jgi:alpha-glucosidase
MILPDDLWVHLWTGTIYQGGQLISVACPIGYPPVFYRQNSTFKGLFEKITKNYHI